MFRYASLFLLVCLLAGCNGANDNADFQPLFEPFEFPDRLQSFVDSRDGETYHEVVIGKKTWMAENLRYSADGTIGYSYGTDPRYAGVYGLLYTYEEAQSACPDGWHLPSDEEVMDLEETFGIKEDYGDFHGLNDFGPRGQNEGQLMKTDSDHWKKPRINNDDYDGDHFFILPAGYYSPLDESPHDLGISAIFHTSTLDSTHSEIIRHFAYYSKYIDRTVLPCADTLPANRNYRLSVRCVKNED